FSFSPYKNLADSQAVVAPAFNPSTQEAEAGGSLIPRPAGSTEQVPRQPGLYRKTLSPKEKKGYLAGFSVGMKTTAFQS
ncbi:hypothetical protein ACQP3L_39560, partial [Escherichia coli]